MGKEETLTVLNLQAECDRLNKKILFLEKENREQRKELSDYAKREEQLLGEIETLESELREITREQRPKYTPTQPVESVEDFLHPKVDTGTGLNRVGKKGFEESGKTSCMLIQMKSSLRLTSLMYFSIVTVPIIALSPQRGTLGCPSLFYKKTSTAIIS